MQTNILFYFGLITMGLVIAPREDDTQSEVSQFSLDKHQADQAAKKPAGIAKVLGIGEKQITGGPKVPVLVEQTELPSEPTTPARSMTLGGSPADAKLPESKSPKAKIKVEVEGVGVEEVAGAIDGAKVGCCGAAKAK